MTTTGQQPLNAMYSILFGASIVIFFLKLLTVIAKSFQNPLDFGMLGSQLMYVTLLGTAAGFVHHWYAYRDLGHIGSSSSLEKELPFWINTKLERAVRIAAIVVMLVAFAKGYVIWELVTYFLSRIGVLGAEPSNCALVDGICKSSAQAESQNAVFLGYGVALALLLLIWSSGALVAEVKKGDSLKVKDLIWWVVTDALAVLFWVLCALLVYLEMKRLSLFLFLVALMYSATILLRFGLPKLKGRPKWLRGVPGS